MESTVGRIMLREESGQTTVNLHLSSASPRRGRPGAISGGIGVICGNFATNSNHFGGENVGA